MPERRLGFAILVFLLAVLGLGTVVYSNARRSLSTIQTPDLDGIRTEAVATYVAQVTAQGSAATDTLTPQSRTETVGPVSTSGTPDCLGLRFVRDVTVPDNTELGPAEVFTKTWQVQNSGTCPWEPGFEVVLIGGTAMGGSPFEVAQKVGPGGSIQVSIKMVAPTNVTGVVQGTWKMADTKGIQFGDYLSVVIVVSPPTPRVSPPASAAVSPTP